MSDHRSAALADVSRELVRLHSEYYGKGPTRAMSYLMDDTLVCLLEGGFTTVERTLIDGGDADAVHDIRLSFQTAMQGEFTKVVDHPVVDRHEVLLDEPAEGYGGDHDEDSLERMR